MRLFLGTYPHAQSDVQPEGIWSAQLDVETGAVSEVRQLVEVPSPSFIAFGKDSQTILAVSEKAEGELFEFAQITDGLEYRAHTRTRGEDPCHLITCGAQTVVTNYSSGSVFAHRLPLSEHVTEGSGQLFQQAGTGPNAERQESPHAHFAGNVPGSQFVWVTDLGADRIFRYVATTAPTGEAQLEARGTAVEFPAGAGPRHIAFANNSLAYVVGELDNRIYTVQIDEGDGSGVIVGAIDIPVTPEALAAGALASHIELDATQKYLFVTVRGADTVVAFEVGPDATGADAGAEATDAYAGAEAVAEGVEPAGTAGAASLEIASLGSNLNVIAQHSVVGTWPRHFRVLDGVASTLLIVIANQGSSTLDVLAFDAGARVFSVAGSTDIPVPACVLPEM